MYPYILTPSSVTIIAEDRPYTLTDHPNVELVKEAIKENDWERALELISPVRTLTRFFSTCETIMIEGDTVYVEGQPASGYVVSKALAMAKEGFDPKPLLNFISNLYSNPSYRAVTELYQFLEKGNMPITPDGYFLAYKKVREDYMDVHSGTIRNKIGDMPTLPRQAVDDNPNNTCSTGLHFAAKDYLQHFYGERVMILKINPADVVSIPTDYDSSKGRCCRYQVVGEVPKDQLPDHSWASVEAYNDEGDDEYDDEYEEDLD